MLSDTAIRPPQLDEFFCEEEASLRSGDFAALGCFGTCQIVGGLHQLLQLVMHHGTVQLRQGLAIPQYLHAGEWVDTDHRLAGVLTEQVLLAPAYVVDCGQFDEHQQVIRRVLADVAHKRTHLQADHRVEGQGWIQLQGSIQLGQCIIVVRA
ncbi:hypothetical protein WR25_16528 [Diploscapter pachys]|uniref:Uncharacterized protein n=1 Tax=Diploscapter pachys TaxID=2018661 RepID=A0A2A2KJ72_9BILA|nr:hypothetical protein WR25_16528 [Diploscapter pachys]